jgi:predicted nucleic acid-binding protein
MNYLLDTNILSELAKPRPSNLVRDKVLNAPPDSLFASEASRYELRFGTALLDRPEPLWARIQALVLPVAQWVPMNAAISERAGNIGASIRRRGRPPEAKDMMIAATAMELRCPLVTRNVSDFEGIEGLTIENWFDEK